MEIREGGFEVTGLPVITRIQVQADDSGLRVIYAGQAYTPDEWREFTEAAVYVRDRLASVRPEWKLTEDIPDHVQRIVDLDGDTWDRRGDFWVSEKYGEFRPEELQPSAPFRLP